MTVQTEPDEQTLLRLIKRVLQDVGPWLERVESPNDRVAPGSALSDDSARCSGYPVAFEVAAALFNAVDHANGIRRIIEECSSCSPHRMTFLVHSNYSLLRGIIENGSRAIWLLAPLESEERVFRRLRLAKGNILHSDAAAKFSGALMKPLQDRLDRLTEVATQAGMHREIKGVGYREIVQSAGEYLGDPKECLFLWSACSAATHGDFWAMNLHDRKELVRTEISTTNYVEVNTKHLATFLASSFTLLTKAFELFDTRRNH